MCADCHSTDLRKNYDAATNSFHTTWKEISVGCEACHGPGSAHLDWARAKPADPAKGLTVALTERAGAHWTIDPTTGTARRSPPREKDMEIGVCAQCHSRRSQIADGYRAGRPFLDFYRPELLSAGMYHADGQQRDEVYIWGSFLQSRMYHAGVTCSDCHEPHGGKPRATGNELCGTCHLASRYDAQNHHHHAGGGAGTRCVDCHMAQTTYMVVDPRRDHSLRVPRPDLSVTLGTPNACNGCHRDHDARWAAAAIERWYGHAPKGFQTYAETFAQAERGSMAARLSLVQIATDPAQPAIARATAFEALERYPSRPTLEAARAGLGERDALVRRASIEALAALPPEQRLILFTPLLDDPVRTVRMEAASALADAIGGAAPGQQGAFSRAALEFEAAQLFNADRPEARVTLGGFYARQGRFDEAQAQLQAALTLDPAFVPAYVNQADLLRVQGRDGDAEQMLRAGLQKLPGDAALHHTLGLTLVRLKRNGEALGELQRATRLAPADARFAYVYAVGLHSTGQPKAALAEIARGLKYHPEDPDLLSASASIQQPSPGGTASR